MSNPLFSNDEGKGNEFNNFGAVPGLMGQDAHPKGGTYGFQYENGNGSGWMSNQTQQYQSGSQPAEAGANEHVVGTGTGHAMNIVLRTSGKRKRDQYRQSSTMEGALTAGMANVHNSQPYMNPDQQAGNSQPSKEGNEADYKRSAKQLSDLKYREKKKQKMIDLESKLAEVTSLNELLTETKKLLEDENASMKKVADKAIKDLKQKKKEVSKLKDVVDGQSATIREMSKAIALDVLRENEQLKHENAVLVNHINNPNIMDIIQLQAKNALLEIEVSSLRLAIVALYKKMKTDVKDDEQERAG